MRPPRSSALVARIRAEHLCRELFQLAFALAVVVMLAGQTTALGGDIFRAAPAAPSGNTSTGGTGAASATSTVDSAKLLQDRAQAALALQQRAAAAFKRTEDAIRAVNSVQQAARAAAAAAASAVPNGLQAGGLEPLDLSAMDKWKGAAAPTTAAGKPNEVVIVQHEQQALLQWKTFNIGKDTTLTFDQSKGGASVSQWIAFNYVQDPSAAPSQILGTLKTIGAADAKGNVPVGGQVYVINPNGILFNGTAQVNVHSLVASSLPINDRLIAQGLLNNSANEFLFSATELNKTGEGVLSRGYGDVTVAAGARLVAPTSADHVGGRIALVGPNVTNAGTLSTPDGQTILAAGLQVGVAAHKTDDPTLRGLDVYVGAAGESGGTARNTGLIDVPRGNATMTGRTVEQLGAIDSSTSVAYNGSVVLDASYEAKSNPLADAGVVPFLVSMNGTVTLGTGSVTRILPEWASSEKVVGSKLALASRINLRGLNIHFAGNAALLAPGAKVEIDAGRSIPNVGTQLFVYEDAPLGEDGQPKGGGQIYLDSGAMIDVSGTAGVVDGVAGGGAFASVSDNVIKVELRGAEFANSPVQRDGTLRGETVYVDIRKHGDWDPALNEGKGGYKWIGTPLGDMTGYVGLVQHSVGQLTTEGGSVAMNAGGAVVIQKDATVDVSGGFTTYTAGEVRTTRLLEGGRVIDIAAATPERKYDGIYTDVSTTTDAKWGVTRTSAGSALEPFAEAGYDEGAKGGRLSIQATSMALDGALRGQVVVGARQRAAGPAAGALELGFKSQSVTYQTSGQAVVPMVAWQEVTPPAILFRNTPLQTAVEAFTFDASGRHALPLSDLRRDELQLPSALFGAEGFGSLKIENGQGDITVAQGAKLTGAPGGALSFSAANISILDSVSAPGGSLAFNAFNYSEVFRASPANGIAPFLPADDRGAFVLGAKARLDTAGLIVDDRGAGGTGVPLTTAGGTVVIRGYAVSLEKGAVMDVSGGVAVGATGKLSYGKGGSIAVEAGQDLSYQNISDGTFALGSAAVFRGYSGTIGAKLALRVPSIQIGGVATKANTLLLQPGFFNEGGFGSYALTGIGERTDTAFEFVPGLLIATNTRIDARQKSRLASLSGGTVVWNPEDYQAQALRNPVTLKFAASGLDRQVGSPDPRVDANGLLVRGDLLVGDGVVIRTDPKGSVGLSGQTVAIGGSASAPVGIFAPGGTIVVAGGQDSRWLFGDPGKEYVRPTVTLGSFSTLSTEGAVVLQPKDARGYVAGTVLGGGRIEVSGNILAKAGATLDVSGTEGVVDRLPAYSGQSALGGSLLSAPEPVPTTESSGGGLIKLSGAQLLLTDATLRGRAGGLSAPGGQVELSSGIFIGFTDALTSYVDPLDVRLYVSQSSIQAGLFEQFQTGVAAAPGLPAGGGFVTADRLVAGGFDRIALSGTVKFAGSVALAAKGSLEVGDGGVLYTDSAVELSAPVVHLGKAFVVPHLPVPGEGVESVVLPGGSSILFYVVPKFGPGSLTVKARELIDVGSLSLQNTGNLNLLVGTGDLRGNGVLDVAGNISIHAGQVYPTTASEFTIAAHDYVLDSEIDEDSQDPVLHPGTVTFFAGNNRALPLSAGGTLNVFGSHLFQSGVLRAPLGTINLGWDGTGTAPKGAVTGRPQSVTRLAVLEAGGTTSVSAVDPVTSKDLTIPYGVILNGLSWIDPRGIDITNGGPPEKRVSVSGVAVEHEAGATIDLRGGGDLYAYRWVGGNGGRNDILASTTSFAVIPGYAAPFAPFAPYYPNAAELFGTDLGYANAELKAGDRIHLGASAALAAGEYTLLPARYALLPGAVLVTPKTGVPLDAALVTPEGASLVSGYRYNSLDGSRTDAPLRVAYEVAPQKVVEARAQYDDSSANKFFTEKAADRDAVPPRLPFDAGQLVLTATDRMLLHGAVSAQGAAGGRGGLVDIGASGRILISGTGTAVAANALVLSAADLSAFKAESLLVGGVRRSMDEGMAVDVTAKVVTLDNAGVALTGTDVALVAKEKIELVAKSELSSTGTLADTAPLMFGDADVAGSGNGVLVRVSADPEAETIRRGIAPPQPTEVAGTDEMIPAVTPTLVVGAGALLDGVSGMLDSSYATKLNSAARLESDSLALSSGRIGLVLDNAGEIAPDESLILAGSALATLQQAAGTLSLQGYDSIDLYGSGQVGALDGAGRPVVAGLELHTAEIRGLNTGEGRVTLAAREVLLDNVAGQTAAGTAIVGEGTLVVRADTLRLGEGTVGVDGFASVEVAAAKAIVATDQGGLSVAGDLALQTPLITGVTAAELNVVADGELIVGTAGVAKTTAETGLGARIALTGASVSTVGTIRLPSGHVSIRATEGDLAVGGKLDVSGTAKTFVDIVKYTDAGEISLRSDAGSVTLTKDAVVSVAAAPGGGDAGTLSIAAPKGVLELPMQESAALADAGEAPELKVVVGVLLGQAGLTGAGGTFSLDVGSLDGASFSAMQTALNDGGFTEARSARVRTGAVEFFGQAKAHAFRVVADGGDLTVTGKIDASGARGGSIDLLASGSVTLEDGAELTVAAKEFDAAGKGGRVSLEAGAYTEKRDSDGVLLEASSDPDAEVAIKSGSLIDLSVAAKPATMEDIEGNEIDLGQRSGTLHLRAPQLGEGTEVQVAQIDGAIKDASSIVVEAYKVFDLNLGNQAVSKAITTTTENAVKANGLALGANSEGIAARLLANNAGLTEVIHIQPGAEIVNRAGDVTLDHAWDLSGYRFGPGVDATIAGSGEPGVLTIRAAGDLVFVAKTTATGAKSGSLNDGFAGTGYLSKLLEPGTRAWSYRLVAGADFSAADSRSVVASSGPKGSILIGKGSTELPSSATNRNTVVPRFFQTIRTGSGDIEMVAAWDVRFLNNLATVYTAGTQAAALEGFSVPKLSSWPTLGDLVMQGTAYGAQYALGGGDVSVRAGHDIAHLRETSTGRVADSSKEMPGNWLYRRSLVDPETGLFLVHTPTTAEEAMSTTWWVDYSNFYEGVGALGGGNVALTAGNNITNVDAVVPTNARMAGWNPDGTAAKPDVNALVELGGGDLTLRAGRDLDGGVYYVERGQGVIVAGDAVRTNATRSTVLPNEVSSKAQYQSTWLPTTLFLGKGSFAMEAGGDLLWGPVANPFLLPSGVNNGFYYSTYFSTYREDDAVKLSSLTGSVALRNNPPGVAGDLEAWYRNILAPLTGTYAKLSQPWLRLNRKEVDLFGFASSLMPSALAATAFSGDIDLVGRFYLMPSAKGQLELLTAGSLRGFEYVDNDKDGARSWASSLLNFSDADPARFPSIVAPIAGAGLAPYYRQYLGAPIDLMEGFNALLSESGASTGVLQTQQALHAVGLLHGASPDPVRLYALSGDISGLTLYSAKKTKVIAGNDLTDVALYLQNNNAGDVSVVSAGRDVVAYSPNSARRMAAQAPGNAYLDPVNVSKPGPATGAPTAGDIQISGPGSLEVLAGRNLDLGIGPNVGDGTGLGLTSVGNARNPALPDNGAEIVALAGIGYEWALRGDKAKFTAAVDALLNPATAGSQAGRYLPALGDLMNLPPSSAAAVWSAFAALPESEQRRLAGDLTAAAHLGAANGLAHSALDVAGFTTAFLDPALAGAHATRYLPALGQAMGLGTTEAQAIWTTYSALPEEGRAQLALGVFFTVLRDAGRDYNDPESPVYRNKEYPNGYAAIAKLFPGSLWRGDIALTSREIKTINGGEIGLVAPGGRLTVGFDVSGTQALDQGILTERGGGISIFTHGSVVVGTSRIFTLRGGNELIWSSTGDIAAGSSSKTVQSAPPTRVLIDPQSGDVKTDLAGLATGGGIGVLATVKGVLPGDIDLVAPTGTIDAGDAGIRSSGKLNIASLHVANAANIAVGGTSTGVPAVTVPSMAGVATSVNTVATSTSKNLTNSESGNSTQRLQPRELPSMIQVEVIGYGGGDKDEDDKDKEKDGDSDAAQGTPAADQAAAPAAPQG